jgi:tRNA(Ile2) C34 agmatinyltransferase TiaS
MARPYHPSDGGADPGRELTAEEIRRRAARLLEEMDVTGIEERRYGGLRCPKCGGVMMHTRLAGYRCVRGCQ